MVPVETQGRSPRFRRHTPNRNRIRIDHGILVRARYDWGSSPRRTPMNGRQMQQGDNDDTLLLDPVEPAYDPRRAPVIDAHIHCYAGADDPRFPTHPKAPYRPERPATPEHLLGCMDGAGVDFGVIVHPEFYQDNHRYLEHCLDVGAG